MISANFRNVSAGPLKVKIDEMRVILNGRTNDDAVNPPGDMLFDRFSPKGIKCGVPIEESDTQLHGTLSLKLIYGPLDEADFARKYTLKLNIHATIDPATHGLLMSDDGLIETDVPYL